MQPRRLLMRNRASRSYARWQYGYVCFVFIENVQSTHMLIPVSYTYAHNVHMSPVFLAFALSCCIRDYCRFFPEGRKHLNKKIII